MAITPLTAKFYKTCPTSNSDKTKIWKKSQMHTTFKKLEVSCKKDKAMTREAEAAAIAGSLNICVGKHLQIGSVIADGC